MTLNCLNFANHSEGGNNVNFEDEVILPEDFEEAPPQAEETEVAEETTETVEEPSQELTEQQQEEQRQAFLKVKYNKEEMDLDEDTARELAQKGLNYDKVQERLQQLESDPRLSFVEELAKEQGMDVNSYLQAVQEWKEQEKLNQLVQQNIPEDLAKEILETRKFREQIESEKKTQSQQEREKAEFQDFFKFFKDANDREFDAEKDILPPEVWEAHSKGTPLKFAYMQHHNAQLKAQLKTIKQNEETKKKAPVTSVSAYGSDNIASEDDFLRGFDSI